jgi:hypothetical protein
LERDISTFLCHRSRLTTVSLAWRKDPTPHEGFGSGPRIREQILFRFTQATYTRASLRTAFSTDLALKKRRCHAMFGSRVRRIISSFAAPAFWCAPGVAVPPKSQTPKNLRTSTSSLWMRIIRSLLTPRHSPDRLLPRARPTGPLPSPRQ